MFGSREIWFVIYGLLIVISAVLAARHRTGWGNVVLVIIFPFIGFLFVLWDVFRSGQQSDPDAAGDGPVSPGGGTAILLTLAASLTAAGTVTAFQTAPAAIDTLGAIVPQPGAMFVGEIDMLDNTSGSIEFRISEDGAMVEPGFEATLANPEVKCHDRSGIPRRTARVEWYATMNLQPMPVDDGAFSDGPDGSRTIEGTFVSSTSARGTYHHVEDVHGAGRPLTCDYGLRTWTADVVLPEGAIVEPADDVAGAPVFRGSDPFVTVAITESGFAEELPQAFFSDYGFSIDQQEISAADGRTLFWAFFELERIDDVSVRTITGKTRKEEDGTYVVDTEGEHHTNTFMTWRGIEFLGTSLGGPMRLTEGSEGLILFSVPAAAELAALSFVYSFTNEWEEGSKEKPTHARLEIPLTP